MTTPGQSSPQPPPWALSQRRVAFEPRETGELEYHQILRGMQGYRWWTVLLGLLLGTVYYFTFAVPYMLAVTGVYSAATGVPMMDALLDLALPDTQNPTSMLLGLGSVILMLPAVYLAMVSVGLRPVGRIWSAAGRIRWRWLGATLAPALLGIVAMNVVGIACQLAFEAFGWSQSAEAQVSTDAHFSAAAAAISLALVLLLVPFQSATEELVFRGAFAQSIGAWLGGVRGNGVAARFFRGPWLAIVVPAVAFGFAHIYDIWGWSAVTCMALAAGWITWRTGGLEAAVSLHVVNNIVAFGFQTFAVGGQTGQTADTGGVGTLIGEIVGLVLFVWIADRMFAKRGLGRTRIDVRMVPVAQPVATPLLAAPPLAAPPHAAGPQSAPPLAAPPHAAPQLSDSEDHPQGSVPGGVPGSIPGDTHGSATDSTASGEDSFL